MGEWVSDLEIAIASPSFVWVCYFPTATVSQQLSCPYFRKCFGKNCYNLEKLIWVGGFSQSWGGESGLWYLMTRSSNAYKKLPNRIACWDISYDFFSIYILLMAKTPSLIVCYNVWCELTAYCHHSFKCWFLYAYYLTHLQHECIFIVFNISKFFNIVEYCAY